MTTKTIPAGEFKQGCLALLDEVAEGNLEIVVTKRGRPVARIVPVEDPSEREAAVLARLRRTTRVTASEEELLEPTGRSSPWRLRPKAPRR